MRKSLALLAAGALGAAVLSIAPAQAASYSFTFATSTPSVTLGSPVKLAGTVKPSAAGTPLTIQQKRGTSWSAVKTIKTGSAGAFSATILPGAPGSAYYRICKAGSGSYKTTCSKSVVIAVYKWHYLTDLEAVDYDDLYKGPVAINGKSYTRGFYDAYVGSSPSYREYNVNRKCKTLTGVYGLSDESRTGSEAQVSVLADGNTLFERAFGLGETAAPALNINNYLRVRFETVGISNGTGHYGIGAVGSPRVLCRF